MTDEQRKAIFDALLGDVSIFAPGDIARRTLEQSAARQLRTLEPLIDGMIHRLSGLSTGEAEAGGKGAAKGGA